MKQGYLHDADTSAARSGVTAVGFEEQIPYVPVQRPGHTAWVNLFLFGNGDVGLSFTEMRRAPNPRFAPPSIEYIEAFCRPYKYSALLCAAQPNLLSESVCMKSSDGGRTWRETGRCWGKSAYLAGYPDGRMVRVVYNQLGEHYEKGIDRFYSPVEESTDGGSTWKQIARLLEGVGFAPHRVKKLRDGALVALGSLTPSYGPGGDLQSRGATRPGERPGVGNLFMFSPDAGHHWTGPHYVLQGMDAPEPDLVELPDGRLLIVNSSVQLGAQVRQIVHRMDSGFLCEPVAEIQGAGADGQNVQSGIVPETVDITPDGLILGTRRGGVYTCSNDLGRTWHVIDGAKNCKYQPQGVCLPDGRFLTAWHLGTDSPFGQQDMVIGLHSFRVRADLPQPATLTLERAMADDGSRYINEHHARLAIGVNPVADRKIELRIHQVWNPDGTYNTAPVHEAPDVRFAVTNQDGVAIFKVDDRNTIQDIHDQYVVQATFTPEAQDAVGACVSVSYNVHSMTGKRDTPYTYPLHLSENALFVSAPTAEQYPELLDLVDRFERFDQDATRSQWVEAMGGETRALEILEFLLSNHVISQTEEGKFRWFRAVHCGSKIIEHVRVDDVPDYNV
jgi:hypothetical protein